MRKQKRKNRFIFRILIVIGTVMLCIMGVCAYNILRIHHIYQTAEQINHELLIYKPMDNEIRESSEFYSEVENKNTEKSESSHHEIQNSSIHRLVEKYSYAVGWLTLNHTEIDYCFAQSKDNDYYLHRTLDGEYLFSGTLFLDYRCQADFSDFNSVIYGHNMNDGSMFGRLSGFGDEEYFASHRDGKIYLENQTYSLEIMAYLIVHSQEGTIYSPNIDRYAYQNFIKNHAIQYREWNMDEKARFLTLSTCSTTDVDERSVLICRIKD